MSKNGLFKKLCDPSLLNIGWHLAHGDTRDDFATDSLGYADYTLHIQERLNFIIEQLKHNRYTVHPLIDIDVPKSGLSVRPGNVLPIEELIILQSIIYLIAPFIDSKLSPNVISYRLSEDWEKKAKKGKSLFKEGATDEIPFLKTRTIRQLRVEDAWYKLWPLFENEAKKAVTELGYTYLTKTDISSYFENIDLAMLDKILRELLPNEERIIQILMSIFNAWGRRTAHGLPIGRGIPQGNEVSSFLGNIFLVHLDAVLDEFCNKCNGKWLRYVDDVKVFTNSYDDAREAVFVINQALRELHLGLQGEKTEILTGPKLKEELFDEELEKINVVGESLIGLDWKNDYKKITRILKEVKDITKQFTTKLPHSVSNLKGRNSRLFRRCLTIYGQAGRPQFRKPSLEALTRLPEIRVLRSSLKYLLRQQYKYHNEITSQLLDLLENDALPFPYQNAEVYSTLKFMHPKEIKSVASRIRQLSFGENSNWYARQKAIEAIFTYPYKESSIEFIAEKALQDEHPWVRRASMLLFLRVHVEKARKNIENAVFHPDPQVSRIALLWKRNLTHNNVAQATLKRLRSIKNDYNFINQLPYFYLLRCHDKPEIVNEANGIVMDFKKSQSAKIKWHVDHLNKMMSWAEKK